MWETIAISRTKFICDRGIFGFDQNRPNSCRRLLSDDSYTLTMPNPLRRIRT
jgi:hypothetical protein